MGSHVLQVQFGHLPPLFAERFSLVVVVDCVGMPPVRHRKIVARANGKRTHINVGSQLPDNGAFFCFLIYGTEHNFDLSRSRLDIWRYRHVDPERLVLPWADIGRRFWKEGVRNHSRNVRDTVFFGNIYIGGAMRHGNISDTAHPHLNVGAAFNSAFNMQFGGGAIAQACLKGKRLVAGGNQIEIRTGSCRRVGEDAVQRRLYPGFYSLGGILRARHQRSPTGDNGDEAAGVMGRRPVRNQRSRAARSVRPRARPTAIAAMNRQNTAAACDSDPLLNRL